MIDFCYICHVPLIQYCSTENIIHCECSNRECIPSTTNIKFNFSIKNNQIIHYLLPIQQNNILYCLLSSQCNSVGTRIDCYEQNIESGFLIWIFRDRIVCSNEFTPVSLYFVPEVQKMLNRYLQLKAFL